MGFYRWVVTHPVAVAMITCAALVFGLVSLAQLPLNLMPDISYPTLTVRVEYPGAAPEEVESQVARPVEEALSTVEGLVDIESRSRAGIADVVLEFDWSTSMNGAAQDVRERMQTTFLPEGAQRPLILRYDPALDPILRVALAGREGMGLLELRDYAERDLKRRLEAVDGVAAVVVRGGLERVVTVEPREDWLAARGVTLDQVSSLLGAENVNLAGGIVREGENEYLIRTLNEFRGLDDVRELRLRRPDGALVRLGDVAVVGEGSRDREVVARLGGREAVEVEVYKEANANIVRAANAVKASLAALPADTATWTVLDDQAAFIEAALWDLVGNAFLGGLLAVLVTFVFLRDWLATAIISSAIPICLVCTFGVMYVGGTSLNLMSLGGLALGISMVIDAGTVVLENIQNHRDRGVERREAAVRGASEVAAAVFASVLTGMAVFFPIVFVEGIAGQIFGDLALTVVFALAASLAVALLIIPMLAGLALALGDEVATAREIAPFDAVRETWRVFRRPRALWRQPFALARLAFSGLWELGYALGWTLAGLGGRGVVLAVAWPWRRFRAVSLWAADRFLAVYGRVEGWFGRFLAQTLRRPGLVAVVSLLATALSWQAYQQVGSELIPTVHQGRFTAELALPTGTPLARTDGFVTQIEREVMALPGVASVYAVVGSERRAESKPDEGEHTARVLVELEPGGNLEAREAEAMDRVRDVVAAYPGMSLRFSRPALFSFRTPVEIVLHGNEIPTLRRASDIGMAALAEVPGLTDLRSSLTGGYPEVRIRYDRLRLDAMGLAVGDVARAVRNKVQGTEPTRVAEGERRVDLLVRLAEQDRASLADLASLNVNPRLAPPVRLDSVARLEEAEGPSEIRRIDQRRAVVLAANVVGFDLAGSADRAEEALRRAGLPAGIEIEVAGQNREMERSAASLWLALGLAVFLVYVIMASTFESIRDPFVILFSVPLALVGVGFGLLVTGTPVSVVVFIGMIVLTGVVVANAIVLVDAINRLRDEGQPLDEAIQAAAALRLRPILITALNSVLGLLPLALGLGEGAEMQRPMAITIIFGLASSTVLTLIVIPVVYRLVSGRRRAAA